MLISQDHKSSTSHKIFLNPKNKLNFFSSNALMEVSRNLGIVFQYHLINLVLNNTIKDTYSCKGFQINKNIKWIFTGFWKNKTYYLCFSFCYFYELNCFDPSICRQSEESSIWKAHSSKYREEENCWLLRIYVTSRIALKRKKKENVTWAIAILSQDASKLAKTVKRKWETEAWSYHP